MSLLSRSVGARILIVIVMFIAFLFAGAAIGIFVAQQLRGQVHELATSGDELQALNSVRRFLTAKQLEILLGLQHDPANPFAKFHDHPTSFHTQRFEAFDRQLQEWLARLKKHPLSPELQTHLGKIEEALARISSLQQQSFEHLANDRYFEAGASLFQNNVNRRLFEFGNLADEFEKSLIELNRKVQQYANEQAQLLTIAAIGASLVALGIGAGVGLWLYRSIVRPVQRLSATMRLVESTSDLTQRVGQVSNDELGAMARAFDQMLERIATVMRDALETSRRLGTAADAMASTAAQVQNATDTQTQAAAAVASAVEETSASITETATHAAAANERTIEVRHEIEQTIAAVRHTASEVQQLAQMIATASSDVAKLVDSSQQISGIVQTIKDIADQTNLLALNAAIEAARAGEQGRGFAVVADEVRKLAEKTSAATAEIAKLITGIQSEVDTAVERMRHANQRAEEASTHVLESTATLDTASDGIGQVAQAVGEIAVAVKEQDTAVHSISNRIEEIAHQSEQSAAAAKHAAQVAQELNQLAARLRQAVERFRA